MLVSKLVRQHTISMVIHFKFCTSSDPYHWAWLPYAKQPFSDEIRELVLNKLEDMEFVQELVDDLHHLFKVNLSTFEVDMHSVGD